MAEPHPNPVILIPAHACGFAGVHRSGYGRAEIAGALAIGRPMFYNCHLRQVGLVLPGFTV